MTLANPIALLWGLLAVPIVLLYMRELRQRREPFATNMIWQQVFAEQGTRVAWRRWRHGVSLAVQLTALGLLVLAMAEPQMTPPERLVIIIDNSAAMNFADGEQTRLDQAKQAAKRLVAGVRLCDRVAIMSAGAAAAVRCNLTNEPATINAAIESIPAGESMADVGAMAGVGTAVALARGILKKQSDGRIIVLSSRHLACAAEDVELFRVGKSTRNVAITRLGARRQPAEPDSCQVLVEVTNFSDTPASREVTLSFDGEPLQSMSIDLPAGGAMQHVFQLAAIPSSGVLTGRIDPRDTFLASDDVVSIRLPLADVEAGDLGIRQLPAAANDFRVPKVGKEAASLIVGQSGVPPWVYPAALAVLLLVVQWCLYQRRWVS